MKDLDGDRPIGTQLQDVDIVVANYQQLQGNKLYGSFRRDFFDAVIVDEAHHAEAQGTLLSFLQAVLIHYGTTLDGHSYWWAGRECDTISLLYCRNAMCAPTGYRMILDHFRGAHKVFLTATPYRGDGKDLRAELIHRTRIRKAIKKKYIKVCSSQVSSTVY